MESIKGLAAATARPGCCPKLGLFGGLFDLSAIECPGRLLVIGTDGVGTKLKVIFLKLFSWTIVGGFMVINRSLLASAIQVAHSFSIKLHYVNKPKPKL